jgi:hypothetical protein
MKQNSADNYTITVIKEIRHNGLSVSYHVKPACRNHQPPKKVATAVSPK